MIVIYKMNPQIYYINSYNRLSGTNSNFSYLLPNINEGANRVVVLSASIPKSYYLIQSPYNTFQVIENGITYLITVPPGNYNRKSLVIVVQALLNNELEYTYAITYPSVNSQADDGKYTYTVSNNLGDQPIFLFNTINDDLHEALGFNADSSNYFVENQLKSSNVIKLSLEDSIFLHSDLCQNTAGNNILQTVFTTANPTFSSILFENKSPGFNNKSLTTNRNNVYNFYLTDENNTPLDLNGQNFVISICIYRERDIYSLLKSFFSYFVSKKENV
jgi:hypothetical protein